MHPEKLAIAFVTPETLGITGLDARTTTVCAYTTDRVVNGQGGCLIHHVVPTDKGAQMRSGFWLGDVTHHNALIDRLLHKPLNARWVRRMLVTDRMALDLLLHCGEEMNHLARFLPRLHADQTRSSFY